MRAEVADANKGLQDVLREHVGVPALVDILRRHVNVIRRADVRVILRLFRADMLVGPRFTNPKRNLTFWCDPTYKPRKWDQSEDRGETHTNK